VRSVPRLCNEEQLRLRESLGTAVRRVRQSPASKDVNTEVGEATALEAVTRRQHSRLKNFVRAVVNFKVTSSYVP
jgi:hypothetical protein